MDRHNVVVGIFLAATCIAFGCDEAPTRPPTTPTPTLPLSMALVGLIEVVGVDQGTDFIGCLDNRWIGSWHGFEHGDSGHATVRLADHPETASAGRIEAGQHELALVIHVTRAGRLYSTVPPSRINIREPETGRILDSLSLAGRSEVFTAITAFAWSLTVDTMGRITTARETTLTPQEVEVRHSRCLTRS